MIRIPSITLLLHISIFAFEYGMQICKLTQATAEYVVPKSIPIATALVPSEDILFEKRTQSCLEFSFNRPRVFDKMKKSL